MCETISNMVLVCTNILTMIIGIVLTSFGAFVHWGREQLVTMLMDALVEEGRSEPQVKNFVSQVVDLFAKFGLPVFIFGLILILVAICAVCGVCLKNRLLLGMYAAVLLLILLSLIIVTIIVGTQTSLVRAAIGEIYKSFLSVDEMGSVFYDDIQKEGKCCGYDGPRDYKILQYPSSCCADEAPICIVPYQKGCSDFIWSKVGQVYVLFLYVLIGLSVVVFFFTLISIYLLTRYTQYESLKMV